MYCLLVILVSSIVAETGIASDTEGASSLRAVVALATVVTGGPAADGANVRLHAVVRTIQTPTPPDAIPLVGGLAFTVLLGDVASLATTIDVHPAPAATHA